MRHPREGAPLVAAHNASIPVINAGDGGHCHPTQTLADLLTIHREKGRLDNLTVGFCGDLKYGRTVHSLIAALSRYTGIKLVLISPEELRVPGYVTKGVINEAGMPYRETESLEDAMPELDVLYMTRIQRERFSDIDEYERLKDSYILTLNKLASAKSDLIVLHPLPRVNEISVKVDDDPRACYFKQVLNGKLMRMALILKLLGAVNEPDSHPIPDGALINEIECHNPACITKVEQELDQVFKPVATGVYRCIYCESKAKK
jgi:aspartate carbamoyltransferase catalytic subunit